MRICKECEWCQIQKIYEPGIVPEIKALCTSPYLPITDFVMGTKENNCYRLNRFGECTLPTAAEKVATTKKLGTVFVDVELNMEPFLESIAKLRKLVEVCTKDIISDKA